MKAFIVIRWNGEFDRDYRESVECVTATLEEAVGWCAKHPATIVLWDKEEPINNAYKIIELDGDVHINTYRGDGK